MKRRLLQLTVLISLVSGALLGGSAAAETESGTWRGLVLAHGDHLDYEGVPCPVEAEICIEIAVRYRLVPVTEQARRMLPRVEGGTALLTGTLDSTSDEEHAGTLFVERVRRQG